MHLASDVEHHAGRHQPRDAAGQLPLPMISVARNPRRRSRARYSSALSTPTKVGGSIDLDQCLWLRRARGGCDILREQSIPWRKRVTSRDAPFHRSLSRREILKQSMVLTAGLGGFSLGDFSLA